MEEGFDHPRLSALKPHGLVGHHPIIKALTDEDGGRRHHGYIFQGPKGVGKASTAYQLAEHLFLRRKIVACLVMKHRPHLKMTLMSVFCEQGPILM